MFSGTFGLYFWMSVSSPYPVVKLFEDIAKCPLEGKSHLVESHWYRIFAWDGKDVIRKQDGFQPQFSLCKVYGQPY
jgi:hypothetical protein